MSNRVSIIRTKFEDHTGVSYGWRIADNYGSAYCNLAEAPIEDDLQLVIDIIQHEDGDNTIPDMLEYIGENGVYLDGVWMDAEEVQKLLEAARESIEKAEIKS